MDSPYSRFDSYDFDGDARYQAGLKKVSDKDLLELKIFYYNRFIEPIDLIGFRDWQDGQLGLQTVSDVVGALTMETSHVGGNLGQRDDVCGPEESKEEPVSGEGTPLSFAEVFRMIQAGEEIPGLQKLDIKGDHKLYWTLVLQEQDPPGLVDPIY